MGKRVSKCLRQRTIREKDRLDRYETPQPYISSQPFTHQYDARSNRVSEMTTGVLDLRIIAHDADGSEGTRVNTNEVELNRSRGELVCERWMIVGIRGSG